MSCPEPQSRNIITGGLHGVCEFFDEIPDQLGHPFINFYENVRDHPTLSAVVYIPGTLVYMMLLRSAMPTTNVAAELFYLGGGLVLLTPVVSVVGSSSDFFTSGKWYKPWEWF